MEKSSEKIKYGIYLNPDTMKLVDALHRKDGCKSRSEFVERAIRFYGGYCTAEDYREYLPNIMVTTVKGALDSLENRMCSLMFKNAVELSMMLHVIAATQDVDGDTLSRLRGICIEDVKGLNGSITLEDAYRVQKG